MTALGDASRVYAGGVSASAIYQGGRLVWPLNAVPVGSVFAYAGNQEPKGWLICDGRDCSRYPDLVEVLGGATNVPDYRGRFLRGARSSGGEGGSTEVTVAHMPSHSHNSPTGNRMTANATHSHTMYQDKTLTGAAGEHAHSFPMSYVTLYGTLGQVGTYSTPTGDKSLMALSGSGGAHSHTLPGSADYQHTHTIASAGGSGAHEPLSYTVVFLIRAVK